MAARKTFDTPQRCTVCREPGHNKLFHEKRVTKRCGGCEQDKPLGEFYWTTIRGRHVPHGRCRPCNIAASRAAFTSSPESRLLRLWHSAKSRARKSDLPFSITVADLIALYERQGGKCYYSGRTMGTDNGPEAISIDKMTPSVGYVPENVVLAQWRVNEAKGAMDAEAFVGLCADILRRSPALMRVEEAGCGPVEARTGVVREHHEDLAA